MRVMLVTDIPDALEAIMAHAQGSGGAVHEIVALAAPNETLADKARDASPDVIVVHVARPEEYSFTDLQSLNESAPLPVMFLADDARPEIMAQASHAGVNAYLPVDAGLKAFPTLAEWTRAQFLTVRELKKRLKEKEDKLADRITIERAKGIVMKLKGLEEDTAYHEIRKLAMKRSQPMRVVAEQIIDTESLVLCKG
ncbi:ANTAR domain-containing protein [Thalassospiraceae bacterium LMO-SO8]|jgi:response regulator NasT|nr:ANTAR domain-containing protein [Alphaproteobacteria bacterium LMO-S08]WND77203.1 ANTAR domain-containing protein [Thalassospiraceae bacterium LMO-SO8]|tara:strand:- start:1284 stop:1874 length:591 start_codon:yes stop_codon:yes gene_type:complete